MKKKIIVIAGNHEEFNYYKRLFKKEWQEKLVYAVDANSLYEIEAERIVYTGTFYKRKDFRVLDELAKSRIR